MRLGRKKRINIRTSRFNKKRVSAVLFLCLLFLLLLCGSLHFLKIMRPVLESLAEAKAHNLAQTAINDAVNEQLEKHALTYQDIISFEKNEDGQINAVKSNLAGVSRFKADFTLAIQEKMAALNDTTLAIPLGSATGTDLLAGTGPRMKLHFMPYGLTDVNFISNFSEAGINQTRVDITLSVKTNLGLFMPTIRKTTQVETTVPVVQTVIVGEVPGSYVNVDRDGQQFEEDVLQLAPVR